MVARDDDGDDARVAQPGEDAVQQLEAVDRRYGAVEDVTGNQDGRGLLLDGRVDDLVEGGFLRLDEDEKRKYNRIQEGSIAFALEDGRVYLNETGRFPNGSVKPGEEPELLDQLSSFLAGIQVGGDGAIRSICRRDEIYRGDYLSQAPHLVLLPNPGFKLMGRLTADLYQPSRLPGMHNDQAFVLVRAPRAEEIVPDAPTVEDIVPIIAQ